MTARTMFDWEILGALGFTLATVAVAAPTLTVAVQWAQMRAVETGNAGLYVVPRTLAQLAGIPIAFAVAHIISTRTSVPVLFTVGCLLLSGQAIISTIASFTGGAGLYAKSREFYIFCEDRDEHWTTAWARHGGDVDAFLQERPEEDAQGQ